jgi:pyridoxamine 5'-phosphate oxidase
MTATSPRHPQLAPHSQPLLEPDVLADPFSQFEIWYGEAASTTRIVEAAALATVAPDGRPSLRMVLVQGRDERGLVFFTNYGSRKGEELEANPAAALLFYWDALGRQVRIEGDVEKVSAAESDAYFATRPRGAQLSAWASRQSSPVENRRALEERVDEKRRGFEEEEVGRPQWWGGFRLRPDLFEFWQNRDDRLHDRLVYRREAARPERWQLVRLSP